MAINLSEAQINAIVAQVVSEFKSAPAAPAAPVAAENDDALIAAITAAIACYMEEGVGFTVRRVRRISNAPAWQKAGREEQIYSRF